MYVPHANTPLVPRPACMRILQSLPAIAQVTGSLVNPGSLLFPRACGKCLSLCVQCLVNDTTGERSPPEDFLPKVRIETRPQCQS